MGEKVCAFSSQDRVNVLWDSFVSAENKSYEKGVWLDIFLAEFLTQIKSGKNAKDIVPYGDSGTVSTLIACELLSDVHEICTRPNGEGDNDDLALLRRHLLLGRGWRCLAVIQFLGTQDVSCAKELAGLLISLYSINDNLHDSKYTQTESSNAFIMHVGQKQPRQDTEEVDIAVRLQVPMRKKSRTLQHYSPGDNNSPPLRYRKISNVSNNRRSANLELETKTKNVSSESETVEDDKLHTNNNNNSNILNTNNNSNSPLRSNKNLKIRLNPMDFDYFTSVIRSENEQRLDSESYVPGESKRQKARKILPQDFYDDTISSVFKERLNTIELKFIIIDLLKKLTACENLNMAIKSLSANTLMDKSVSVQSLVFTLDALSQCKQQISNDNHNINIQLKYNLIRLLLLSLEKLLKLPDVMSIIIQKGVIPIMKRLLEDALLRTSSSNDCNSPNISLIFEDTEFVYSLLYGAITLLHCLLLQNSSQEKLNQFLLLFHQFNSNRLVDRSILLLLRINRTNLTNDDNSLLTKRCKKIISSIGHLISSLKKTRSKIIHIRNCKRTRHKHCTPLNVMHHHETLFGTVFTNSVLTTEMNQNCCVSTLFMILTKFLSESVENDIMLYTMHIMMSCGTCCCFPSSQFITKLISVIRLSDYKMRNVALILLERTYYRQFGAFHENSSCDICFKGNFFLSGFVANTSTSELSNSSSYSPFSSPDKQNLLSNRISKSSSEQSMDDRQNDGNHEQNRTSILVVFRDLLLSSDYDVSYSVGSHLLRVTPKCNLTIQREILFTVFYPAFLVAKKRFMNNKNKNVNDNIKDDKDKYVLTTCLSAFTNLLSRVRFTEEFLKLNALEHIEDLLFEPDLIKLCCSIIEIAVIVQVWKSEYCDDNERKNNSEDDDDKHQLGIDDLEMFLRHVKSATVSLLKIVNEHSEIKTPVSSVPSSSSSFVSNLISSESIQEGIEASESFICESPPSTTNEDHLEMMIDTSNQEYCSTLSDHATFSNLEKWESFSQLLENCSVLWRTCANITLYSPQLRKYFSKHVISKYCYDLLFKTLDGIAKHTAIKGETSTSCHFSSHLFVAGSTLSSPTKLAANYSNSTLSELLNEKFYNANQVTLKLFESVLILNLISPVVDEQTGSLMTEDALLSILRNTLVKILDSGHINARHLCDVLLRACSIAPSQRLVLPTHKMPKVGFIDSSMWHNCSDMSPPLASFYYNYIDADSDCMMDVEMMSNSFADILPDITGDEGYEADIEVPKQHDLHNKEGGSDDENMHDDDMNGVRSLASSRKISAIGPIDVRRDLMIVHPGLCTIAIHLLAHHLQTWSEANSVDISARLSDTVYCLQRLAALAQESAENCRLLNRHNVLYQLLTKFKPFLVTANPNYMGLQHAIFNVVTRLSECGIEPKDLSQLLSLFTEDNPPLEALLSALVNMVTSIKVQPSFVLCFPTNNLTSSNIIYSTVREPAEKLALTMREQHSATGVDSCWSRSSVIIGINQELGWSMWASGFSLSLWLSIDKSLSHLATNGHSFYPGYNSEANTTLTNISSGNWDKQDLSSENGSNGSPAPSTPTGLLHVISVGYDLMTIEFWIDNLTTGGAGSGTVIIVRLVRSDGGATQEILSESKVNSQLTPGMWHHMAVNVQDSVQKRKVCIEVTILIDGWSETHLSLSFTGLLVRKSRPYCVAVGHHSMISANNTGSRCCNCSANIQCNCAGRWLLGSLMMFRAPVFTKETATYLLALGPDHTHLTETDVGNSRPNFSRLFTAKGLSSGLLWEKLLNDQTAVIKQLQENLLLIYSAQTPNTVRVYPQITSNSATGIVGSLLNSQPIGSGFRVVTIDKRSSQHLPMSIVPAVNCTSCVLHTHTFITAANTIGGLPVFLFLFARVVEMESSEEIQVRALYLLLRLVQSSTEFNSEFVTQQQHRLLTHVISSNRCRPGLHMLKVILDTACDRPGLLICHIGTGQFQTCNKSGAILVNPALITGPVLSAWRDWEHHPQPSQSTTHPTCLNTLLQCLLILLREDHPHHEFNAAQLNRVNLVDVLLQMCKERFLVDEPSYALLDADTCKLLVDLIAALMSSPPKTEHINSIVRFLILSHPAHATYVTHIRSSFYFLLPTTTTASHTNLSHRHLHHRNAMSRTNDDLINDARINILSNGLAHRNNRMKRNARHFLARDRHSDTIDNSENKHFNFPIDPVKLNKALINLKIKQNEEDEDAQQNNAPAFNQILEDDNGEGDVKKNEIVLLSDNKSDNSSISGDSNDLHDGNGCDSGIAGSFKDNVEASIKVIEIGNSDNDYEYEDNIHKKNSVTVGFQSNSSSSAHEVHEDGSALNLSRNNQCSSNGVIYCRSSISSNSNTNSYGYNIDLVTEGLLLLLKDFVVVLPDSKAEHILNNIMRMEVLIIMANHPSPRVRVAVIKVLQLYLERATEDELGRFLQMKGFYLVANQLHSQNATHELVGSVAALITGQHWLNIDDQLPTSNFVSHSESSSHHGTPLSTAVVLTPLQMSAIPAFLALVQKTVHDPPLAHASILFLGRLFNKVTQAYKPLMESGLIEVLLKTMLAISHQQSSSTSEGQDCDEMWQRLLITDIHNLLIMIISHAIHTAGSYHMKVVLDILLLFSYIERIEQRCCGSKAKCVYMIRTCHCVLLASALDIIHNVIHQAQRSLPSRIRSTATAFLSSVFSSGADHSYGNVNDDKTDYSNSSSSSTFDKSSLSQFSPWNQSSLQFTQSELADRFELILTKAVELIVNNVPVDGCYSQLSVFELNFINDLLTTLLSSTTCIIDRKITPRTSWTAVMWSSKDVIKTHLGKLLVWLLSPGQLNKVRVSVVNKLRNEHKCKEIILYVFENNHQLSDQFLLYLWDLINGPLCGSLQPSELQDCEELNQRLQSYGFILPQDRPGICCDEDVSLLWDRTLIEQKAWWKQQDRLALRIVSRLEGIVKSVNEAALTVTKTVTDEQNSERKIVIELLKNDLSDRVHTQILWKNIVRQLVHECAVWHFPKSYPKSWQLDPTEGPNRIRNRLQRCHLTVMKKYLKQEFQDKVDAGELNRPLSYLFEKEGKGQVTSMSALLIEKLHTDKKIRHMVTAQVITPAQSVPGELLIGETCLYFVPSSDNTLKELNAGSSDISVSSQAWNFDEIKEVHTRRFQLKERALEIFLLSGKTYLLAFESSADRDKFQSELFQCELPNRIASDHLSDAIQLWREGHLTNWEYLTILNKMAGRSYNDLMQYPVMPFILADYTSKMLDLTDPSLYRNLEKPMAVQDKRNEQHYINNYNYLKQEQEFDTSSYNQGSYHYGSHYSNSGVVLHFLVRLPPFTSMFLTYQDDNFDLPDRTFHSMDTTWRLTSRESTTDVKELIPEFFFLPEFLTNMEGFDFGVRQNGEKVDNVSLPPWAENDPRKFILIHRQALESDYVRENIPHWIDLVFGYKQTGKAAVDAINVFHPATYCGFDVEAIEDPLERCAWETMVRTYGQTPRQLFKSPHPMCVQSLISNKSSDSVHCTVKGIQWGSFVGSPDEPAPSIAYKHQHRLPVTRLVPLLTNDVFGLAPSTTLLLTYSKTKSSLISSAVGTSNSVSSVTGSANVGGLCVHGAAMVFWGHADGVLRVKMKRDIPPYPVARPPGSSWDVITQCTSAPDTNQLWIGYLSGRILVYKYAFTTGQNRVEFSTEPVVLVGHTSAVLSISVSHGFSIALSGCRDGVAILWDTNNLSYIRSLPTISVPIRLTCISEMTGDIVTVGHDDDSSTSILRLHSINVVFLGSITTHQRITAVCFSTAPEGISVNVIATGMEDGSIKFWSTWDLSSVGTELAVSATETPQPILCLMYSYDSHHLYATLPSGHIIIWESRAANSTGKLPKFLNLSSLSL